MRCLNKFVIFLHFAIIFFSQINSTLIAESEVKQCYIKDYAKHQHNQQILSSILKKEMSGLNNTPKEKADYLSKKIREIGLKLLKNGFHTDAYAIPQVNPNTMMAFNCFPLWEGERNNQEEIPLTFFVYVWPSEKIALRYNSNHPNNHFYGSNIHSHPIPCALAVLEGSLVQKSFERIKSSEKIVRLIQEEIFSKGQGDVDDLQKPFIHQLYNKGPNPITLSLHAYGLSSEQKVMDCFDETFSDCSY